MGKLVGSSHVGGCRETILEIQSSNKMIHGLVCMLRDTVFFCQSKEMNVVRYEILVIGLRAFNSTFVEPTDEQAECSRIIFR
jgi:hypothetical protein